MNKILLATTVMLYCVGCTSKIQYLPGATGVHALSNSDSDIATCKKIGASSVQSQHPNNFRKAISNEVYMQGGTHYKIVSTDEGWTGKVTGAAFDIYKCENE